MLKLLKTIILTLVVGNFAFAAEDPAAGAGLSCPDAELFGPRLFTDICWACLFPIRVAGIPITPGIAPSGASKDSLCMCADNLGVYMPGIVNSMWEPARLVEVVRKPGCAMSLGGSALPLGDKRQWGSLYEAHAGGAVSSEKNSFYSVHYYAFPILSILELYMPKRCSADGYTDFDIIQLSEIDPTWNNDELSFFVNPESAAVSNPIAQAACLADSSLGVVGKEGLDTLWWCGGTWGNLYPMAGVATPSDFSRTTSLIASRTLGLMHRRGQAHLTMGEATQCRAKIFPTIPKSQYKMSMFFPRPETKRAHSIGSHPWNWQGGEGRAIPMVGEDALYMLFRWNDCCNTL